MENYKSHNVDTRAVPAGCSDGAQEDITSPKTRGRSRSKKRKRSSSESSTDEVLPENTLDMEKSLCASAIKNNLDESSVKKILKKVVTNDHVLAYVKLREEEEDSGTDEGKIKPKLTRAKVKELMKVSPQSAPWNPERLELSPIKQLPVKTRPEVTALIAHDMPDEEDDDEYHPTLDDIASDDDHTCSDLDSQPRTPATPQSLPATSPHVLRDGPFKVPTEIHSLARRRLKVESLSEEDATIALRTRSKLSLHETPIEHIESSFVPPDEVPLPIVDDLWNQFLEECLNPASAARHEDDDEADPEYNVASDPDAHDEDEEALERSIVKISKKELNDLVTELFHIMPEELDTDGKVVRPGNGANGTPELSVPLPMSCPMNWKKEPVSDDEGSALVIDNRSRRNSCVSIGKAEPMEMDIEGHAGSVAKPKETLKKAPVQKKPVAILPKSTSIEIEVQETDLSVKQPINQPKVPPILAKSMKRNNQFRIEIQVAPDGDQPKVLPEQIQILQQQLRQHVQLCASNFLQLFVHPVFWEFAPNFKEYLETFEKVLERNPQSVVGVCNMKPALELMRSWEASVSENTPHNMSMVRFLQKEVEMCRRRYAQNNLYLGNFHESYKQVVANSAVFLYPYLLPPVPYRSNTARRAGYLHSEDELIAMGMDQFWQYVEDNPGLYPRHPRSLSAMKSRRHRWGLTKVVELVCRFMFPFMQPRVLNCHINFVRRSADKDNPIYKFFHKREIVPVKHTLLPFNQNMTLYQQPEHEMPLMWLKYIAKSSKRAKAFLKRNTTANGFKPQGVEINLGKSVVPPEKKPLPADFTKKITCRRANARPPPVIKNNNIEIQVDPVANKIDINPSPATDTAQTAATAKLFTVVTQSDGSAYLVPLELLHCNTTTVNSLADPITTPAALDKSPKDSTEESVENGGLLKERDSADKDKSEAAKDKDVRRDASDDADGKRHCKCCSELMRIISNERQKKITAFFKSKNSCTDEVKCPCSKVEKSPKITARLRALLRHYKCQFSRNWRRLELKISQPNDTLCRGKKKAVKDAPSEEDDCEPSLGDIAYAATFTTKLQTRLAPAKFIRQRTRVDSLLTNFDDISDSPVWLCGRIRDQVERELPELVRHFAGFLSPDQADQSGVFSAYFVQNCVPSLMTAIDKDIQNPELRQRVLLALRAGLRDGSLSSCELSRYLLKAAAPQPALARYIFSLFPHRRKDCVLPENTDNSLEKERSESPLLDDTASSIQRTGDYEADHSSSGEEENEHDSTLVRERQEAKQSAGEDLRTQVTEDSNTVISVASELMDRSELPPEPTIESAHPSVVVKQEPVEEMEPPTCVETQEMTISKTEIQEESSDMSMSLTIVSDEESIKTEPSEPWKKEEDKAILVAIKTLAAKEHDNILEDMNFYSLLSNEVSHRSRYEIRDRVTYLLELIALIKNNDL